MNPVVHFEMPAENKKRMINFYSKVFGWQTQMMGHDMGEYVVVTTTESDKKSGRPITPGAINGGFYLKTDDQMNQHPSVVIAVNNIQESMRKTKAAGGKIHGKPDDIPGVGKYVSFIDTESNRVSMLQPLNNMEIATDKKAQTLTITRIFDAPRKLLWRAWTDPEMIKKWWGPKNYTSPIDKVDLRVGGKYLFCMRSPEGKDFWTTGIYKEIVPFKKLVVTDSFADTDGKVVPAAYYGMDPSFPLEMLATVTFDDFIKVRSKLTLYHDGFPEGEMKDMAEAGWNESFDKLSQVL